MHSSQLGIHIQEWRAVDTNGCTKNLLHKNAGKKRNVLFCAKLRSTKKSSVCDLTRPDKWWDRLTTDEGAWCGEECHWENIYVFYLLQFIRPTPHWSPSIGYSITMTVMSFASKVELRDPSTPTRSKCDCMRALSAVAKRFLCSRLRNTVGSCCQSVVMSDTNETSLRSTLV